MLVGSVAGRLCSEHQEASRLPVVGRGYCNVTHSGSSWRFGRKRLTKGSFLFLCTVDYVTRGAYRFRPSCTCRWGWPQSVPVHHRSLAPPFPRGPAQPSGREWFVGRRAGQAAFTRAAAEPFPRPSGKEKVLLSRCRRRVCPASGVARRCWGGRSRGLRCAPPLPAEAERRVVGGFSERRRGVRGAALSGQQSSRASPPFLCESCVSAYVRGSNLNVKYQPALNTGKRN